MKPEPARSPAFMNFLLVQVMVVRLVISLQATEFKNFRAESGTVYFLFIEEIPTMQGESKSLLHAVLLLYSFLTKVSTRAFCQLVSHCRSTFAPCC